jgi:hypothetical protein
MAKLVNYKKRGFTLPPGCKNLMDVLERPRRQTKEPGFSAVAPALVVKEEHFPSGGLAQLGRCLSMMLQSRGQCFTLLVTAQELDPPVVFYHSMAEPSFAIVLEIKDAQREQAVRAFFEGQGIEATWDFDISDYGGANASRGLAYPLPADAAPAITLATGFLRSVYGLSDGAGLDFQSYEV